MFWYFAHNLGCFLIIGFKNSLYILDISPLSDKGFADIFLQSMAYITLSPKKKFLISV